MESLSLAVSPIVGVGDMRFGQSRREIHSLMGRPSEMFRRSVWSRNLTDRYDQLWLTLDYSDSGDLDFVEVGAGRCAVTLGGVQLFLPGRAVEVADHLRDGGFATRPIDSGLSIVGAGVNLYIPSTENDAAVESVSAASGNLGELDVSFFSVSQENRKKLKHGQ